MGGSHWRLDSPDADNEGLIPVHIVRVSPEVDEHLRREYAEEQTREGEADGHRADGLVHIQQARDRDRGRGVPKRERGCVRGRGRGRGGRERHGGRGLPCAPRRQWLRGTCWKGRDVVAGRKKRPRAKGETTTTEDPDVG